MCEKAFRVGVTFAAENFVAVNGELIEENLFLSRGFLDKSAGTRFRPLPICGDAL
jgi:hypothetical protein